MTKDDPPDNVVYLPVAGVKPILQTVAKQSYCPCHFEIDDHKRTITCRSCGKLWDAFEAMHFLARHQTRLGVNRDHLKLEAKHLSEEIDALKKEIHNLRAQKKRLEKKA